MKINPLNQVNNPYARRQVERQQLADSIKKRDQIEISQAAKEMQLSSRIDKERQQRVNELKEQIDNGTYQINAHAVARKFYDYWNEL